MTDPYVHLGKEQLHDVAPDEAAQDPEGAGDTLPGADANEGAKLTDPGDLPPRPDDVEES